MHLVKPTSQCLTGNTEKLHHVGNAYDVRNGSFSKGKNAPKILIWISVTSEVSTSCSKYVKNACKQPLTTTRMRKISVSHVISINQDSLASLFIFFNALLREYYFN